MPRETTRNAACTCDPEAYDLGPEGQKRYFPDRGCPQHGDPEWIAAFICPEDDVDESAGLAELEPDPDARRDWERDTQALDESRRDGEDAHPSGRAEV